MVQVQTPLWSQPSKILSNSLITIIPFCYKTIFFCTPRIMFKCALMPVDFQLVIYILVLNRVNFHLNQVNFN